jgi:hypothetical protein
VRALGAMPDEVVPHFASDAVFQFTPEPPGKDYVGLPCKTLVFLNAERLFYSQRKSGIKGYSKNRKI